MAHIYHRRRRARDGRRPAADARDLPRRWSRQAGARASSLLHRLDHPPQMNLVLQALAAATVPGREDGRRPAAAAATRGLPRY